MDRTNIFCRAHSNQLINPHPDYISQFCEDITTTIVGIIKAELIQKNLQKEADGIIETYMKFIDESNTHVSGEALLAMPVYKEQLLRKVEKTCAQMLHGEDAINQLASMLATLNANVPEEELAREFNNVVGDIPFLVN